LFVLPNKKTCYIEPIILDIALLGYLRNFICYMGALLNKDISPFLDEWEYISDSVTARWITGFDGLQKIQMRIDLGLLQMETDGRPDGVRPRGYPSLLDFYLSLEKTSAPGNAALRLNEDACGDLHQESVQYYHRYIAFESLKDYGRVIRDTEHNLEIFKLVSRRAENTDLIWPFLQFFPDVRVVNANALAEKFLLEEQTDKAKQTIRNAMQDIRTFYDDHGDFGDPDISQEEASLAALLDNIEYTKPKSTEQLLHEKLERAISTENFEKAAMIRDEINEMKSGKSAKQGLSSS